MKRMSMCVLLAVTILLGTTCATTPESIVQQQVQAYNARDLDSFVGLYAGDAAIHKLLTGELVGQGEAYFRQRYQERFTSSPDLQATIHDRLVLGDFVIDWEEVVRRRSEPTVSALAVYHVDRSQIDHVWFVFDEDVKLGAADATKAAMARHAQAVRQRDAAAYESTWAPTARIVSLSDGQVVSRNRDEIMGRIRPFLAGDRPFTWSIEKQIVFGNVVASLEQLAVGENEPSTRRLVIYEFSDATITGCWITPDMSLPGETAPMVATHYFYWYRWPDQHFNQPGAPGPEGHFHHWPHPEQVSYASTDWHAQQFAAMHRAGIDVALPVYWGAPGAYDRASIRFSRDGLQPMIERCDRSATTGSS